MPDRRWKPRDRAVALRYNFNAPAPFLVAKAEGHLAEALLKIAGEHGIPIIREEGLANLLYPLDLGSCIPPEFYEVIAAVFAWIQASEEP